MVDLDALYKKNLEQSHSVSIQSIYQLGYDTGYDAGHNSASLDALNDKKEINSSSPIEDPSVIEETYNSVSDLSLKQKEEDKELEDNTSSIFEKVND